jgi:hypothetical protein
VTLTQTILSWNTYLLLSQVVGKVSDHDLVLGRDAIGRGAPLTTLTGSLGLSLGGISIHIRRLLAGNVSGRRSYLASSRCISGAALSSSCLLLLLVILWLAVSTSVCHTSALIWTTYTTASTATTTATSTTATSTATATGGLPAAGTLAVLSVGTFSLVGSSLGLASKLDGDLALQDLLARELSNGALSLAGSGQVNKGVADRAVGARVLRDGNGLAVEGDCQ